MLATVHWDGGGNSFLWSDAANWQGDSLPGLTDTAVLPDSAIAVEIDINAQVRNLESSGGLTIRSSASLSLSGGSSSVIGGLNIQPDGSLLVSGPGVTFVATGGVNVSGANLVVTAGAVLSLPTARFYDSATSRDNSLRVLRATGPGSRLELGDIGTITNGTHFNSRLLIEATDGGTVDLSNVTALVDPVEGDQRIRRIDVSSSGAGSLVNLEKLTSFEDQLGYDFVFGHYSSMTAAAGGEIRVPQLSRLDGVSLVLDGAGILSIAQITQFTNANIVAKGGATVSFVGLASIDGANLYAEGGATLRFPLVTSYSHASFANDLTRVLRATGPGSRLELGGIGTVTNGTHYNSRLLIEATNGGTVDLSNVTALVDPEEGDQRVRRIDVSASGAGSLVNLEKLTSFEDQLGYDFVFGHYSSMTAAAGGEIRVPQLSRLDGVSLVLDGAGILSIAQITQFTNANIVAKGGATVSFVGLASIDGANLYAEGGATLRFPLVTSYSHASFANDLTRVLRATGPGSRLELGGIGTVTNGTHYNSRLLIEATNGSVIDLFNVTALVDPEEGDQRVRRIDVSASGAGSLVNLEKLTSFEDQLGYDFVFGHYSSMTAAAGGEIRVPQLSRLDGVSLVLDGAGILSIAQITQFTNANIVAKGGATVSFVGLASIDGANLYAEGGATLRFPLVTSYSHASFANDLTRVLRATGLGSRLELGGIGTVTNGTHYNSRLLIEATNGGTVDLSNVTALVDPEEGDQRVRRIDVSASGAGSLVNLEKLTSFEDQLGYDFVFGHYSSMTAAAGGEIRVPQLSRLDGVSLVLDGSGILSVAQITQFTNANIVAKGGATFSFVGLANIDGSNLYAENGATLRFPLITSYSHASFTHELVRILRAAGPGSRLELGGIRTVTNGTQFNSRLLIEATDGGTVDLSNVTALVDPEEGDQRIRRIDVSASGAGSLVDLAKLTSFEDQLGYDFFFGHYSSLTAAAGGEIRVPQLTTLNGISITMNGAGIIDSDQFASFTNGRLDIRNQGAFDIGDSSLYRNTDFVLNSGTLRGAQISIDADSSLSGTGSITGSLVVSGDFQPEVLAIGGTLTMEETTTSTFDANGARGSGNWDRVSVTGDVRLDGQLTARLATTVPFGELYDSIVSNGNVQGQFKAIIAPPTNGKRLTVSTLPQSVRLAVAIQSDATIPTNLALELPSFPGEGVSIDVFNLVGGGSVPLPSTVEALMPSGTTLSPYIDFPNPGNVITVANDFTAFFASTTVPPDQLQNLAASNFTLRSKFYLGISSDLDLEPATPEIDVRIGVRSDDGFYLDIGGVFIGQASDRLFSESSYLLSFVEPGLYPVELLFASNGSGQSGLEFVWDTATTLGMTVVPREALYIRPPEGDQLITFEELPSGTALTDQFIDKGIRFNNLSGNLQIVSGRSEDFVPVSPGQLFGDPAQTGGQDGAVELSFVQPDQVTRGTTDYVSFYVIDAATTGARVRAFDLTGTLLFDERFAGGGRSQELVEIRTPNIASVRIELGDAIDRSAIDQLRFTRPRSTASDLAVEQLIVPPTAVPGQATSISWRIANRGDLAAAGTLREKIFLSQNGQLVGAVEVGDVSFTVDLQPGQFVTRTASIVIPFNGVASQGDVHWLIRTDATSVIAESNEQNNIGVSTSRTSIPQVLLATTNKAEVSEEDSNPAATLTLRRSGPLGSAVSGTLSSSDTTELTVQPAFTFDIGVGQLSVPIDVVADRQKDGDQAVWVDATVGTLTARANLTVIDFESKQFTDLRPVAVSLQIPGAVANPGQTIQASWTIRNDGEIATSRSWQDSLFAVRNGENPILLATAGRTVNLQPLADYSVTRTFSLPASIPVGDYRVYVVTDSLGNIAEGLDKSNNQLDASATLLVRHADLRPIIEQLAPSINSGSTTTLDWTLENNGTASSSDNVTHAFYLSTDPTFSFNDRLLSTSTSAALQANSSRSFSQSLQIPEDLAGSWFLLVIADSLNQVLEGTRETNNVVSKQIQVTQAPYADLAVTAINAPQQTIGDPATVSISWTVENRGTSAGRVTSWTDTVVASINGTNGDADDIVLGRFARNDSLQVGQSYSRNESITLPLGFSGRYQLKVHTDSAREVFENNLEENNVATMLQPFNVMPIPYADLVVRSVVPLNAAATGKELTLRWVIENTGIGSTSVGNWFDAVTFSSDAEGKVPIAGMRFGFDHFGHLSIGGSYERTVSLVLPDSLPPVIYATVTAAEQSFSNNVVPFEFINHSNNQLTSLPIVVSASTTADLRVTSVLGSTQVDEGGLLDVTWTVTNSGQAIAQFPWTDRVLLRQVGVANPTEVLLGNFQNSTSLTPGLSYARSEQLHVPSQIRGVYDLVVVTDVDDQVFERSPADANNRTASSQSVNVRIQPRPDLQVDPSTLEAPLQIQGGGMISVAFDVVNQGTLPASVTRWSDRVLLSLDNKVSRDDLLLDELKNVTALAPGERYRTVTKSVTVPIRYRGGLFLIYIADARAQIDEWPNEENNIVVRPLNIVPAPLADLVVSNVVVPPQASDGDSISVRFTVSNLGGGPTNINAWIDTIWLTRDKNRPHPGQGDYLLKSLPRTGILETNASYDVETTVTLPTGLDSGVFYITPWTDPYDGVLEDTLADNSNLDDPAQLDNNNYKAKAIDILAKSPDLQVTQITALPTALGGENLRVRYRVENRGNADATARWVDHIYLSETPNPLDPDARSILLSAVPHIEPLIFGEGYTRELEVLLSPSATGRYLVVIADGQRQLKEASDSNNAADNAIDVKPVPADLKVTNVTFESDTISGESTLIRYTVTNIGTHPVWTGTKSWRDFLWVSADAEFIRERASYMGEVTFRYDRTLNPGDSYEMVAQITLPRGTQGQYYLHIHLDAHNDIDPSDSPYQSRRLKTEWWPADKGSNEGFLDEFSRWAFEDPNNNLYSTPFPIEYREPDLRVSNVVVPAGATSGQSVPITFTVSNIGNRATRVGQWTDRLFISHDASLDSKDYELASITRSNVLRPGENYVVTTEVALPEGIDGAFYILAFADSAAYREPVSSPPSDVGFNLLGLIFEDPNPLEPWDLASNSSRSLSRGRVYEFQNEGNNIAGQSLPVTLANPTDLQVTTIEVPTRADRGAIVDVFYTVTNRGGATPSTQSEWVDLIYLSRDPSLDLMADRYIGSITHKGGLAAGAGYSESFQFQIPTDLTGSWYVMVVTDPVQRGKIGDIFEASKERNNDRASTLPMIVQLPPPSDLEVTGIVAPADVKSGDPIQISWTVKNNSVESARGTWFDTVYLSADSVWDGNDPVVGRVSYTGNLQPGQSYSRTLSSSLPAVIPGNYRFVVRTDVFDNIYEDTSEANNTTVAADATRVTVQSIQLGVPHEDELTTGHSKLFEVVVPVGETLRVNVSYEDTAATTELYIRYDNAPSGTAYDAVAQAGLDSARAAIVPSTRPGSYYVLVRGNSISANRPKLTVFAELLPLAIMDVRSDVAGDGRFFTTSVRGAKFSNDASLKIEMPGFKAFSPINMRVIDSTTIRATFDFTDAPHGLYDVTVTNPDGNKAVVPYRFLIQDTIEPDVTVGIGGPRILLAGDQGLYSVAIQSLSNVDTPYIYFQIGVPEMGTNEWVYGLPYLDFTTNVGGRPPNSPYDAVTWGELNPAVNTNGYKLTSGYVLDQEADGFTGLTFQTFTYPGMRELYDRKFAELREKLYAALPSSRGLLDDGPAGLERIDPNLKLIWESFGQVPGLVEKAFVPFQFNVTASATALTRDEFIQHSTEQAEHLRQGVIASSNAPVSILALAADSAVFRTLYLAALEQSGLLRPDGVAAPILEHPITISLLATLAGGILAGPAGQTIQVNDLTDFFENLRTWYGGNDQAIADTDPNPDRFKAPTFELLPPILEDANPVPKLLDFSQVDLGVASRTRQQSLRVFVPWVAWGSRSNLPADYLITGVTANNEDPFNAVDLSRFYDAETGATGFASLIGPFTAESKGFVSSLRDIPYTVRFQNPASTTSVTSEVRVSMRLDSNADPRTFRLGQIQIGTLPAIDVPADQPAFLGEYDFVASHGFILRVSGGIDLPSSTASWVLQAIDPATGEVIRDPARGLLPANNASGDGAGFVKFTVRAAEDVMTRDVLEIKARVTLNNAPPEDTPAIRVRFDADRPQSQTTIDQSGLTFTVKWTANDAEGGSGLKSTTLYVSEDNGPFRIWKKDLTESSGTEIYLGESGRRYRFLSLATDNAGNREEPSVGSFVADSDPQVSSAESINPTPVNLGIPTPPSPAPSSNALFVAAERGVLASPPAAGQPSDFSSILQPLTARAFATGFIAGEAGIGPMAIVEAPDGSILVSGGQSRNQLFRYGRDGGDTSVPLVTLDVPIFSLAFDRAGQLWATTGGGALLRLNSTTGEIVQRFGEGITMSIAIHPTKNEIYVTSHRGIEIFDPLTSEFRLYSRDRDLRFGSIAFDNSGSLWGTIWPQRNAVVQFNSRARAETRFEFETPIDSIAFGMRDSELAGLLFVTANAGLNGKGGDLTMVDLVTRRRVAIARDGSRGDTIAIAKDGRIFVSQSNQVDVLNAQLDPVVVATNPPRGANVALPFSLVTVTFDQEMFAGDPRSDGSILNPANYTLRDDAGGMPRILRVEYDPVTLTVLLRLASVAPRDYELVVSKNVKTRLGVSMKEDYVTSFRAFDSVATLVNFAFSNSRFERATSTISYDVTITNRSDRPLVLPLFFALDPANGYIGIPVDATRTEGQRWLINFAGNVPGGVRLDPNASTTGRTISIVSPDGLRVNFNHSVSAEIGSNAPPAFTSTPNQQAVVRTQYTYNAKAVDPDTSAPIYVLVESPAGMTVDSATGVVSWLPQSTHAINTEVVLRAYDPQGAWSEQIFTVALTGGNNLPVFAPMSRTFERFPGSPNRHSCNRQRSR